MTDDVIVTEEQKSTTCIFRQADGVCEKLVGTVCSGSCSFKILPGGEEERRAAWAKRLCALEESKQREISKKYYGGARPWRENQ